MGHGASLPIRKVAEAMRQESAPSTSGSTSSSSFIVTEGDQVLGRKTSKAHFGWCRARTAYLAVSFLSCLPMVELVTSLYVANQYPKQLAAINRICPSGLFSADLAVTVVSFALLASASAYAGISRRGTLIVASAVANFAVGFLCHAVVLHPLLLNCLMNEEEVKVVDKPTGKLKPGRSRLEGPAYGFDLLVGTTAFGLVTYIFLYTLHLFSALRYSQALAEAKLGLPEPPSGTEEVA